MKEPNYPHFFFHFLVEKLLAGKQDKLTYALADIHQAFAAYYEQYQTDSLPGEAVEMSVEDIQDVLENFLQLKPKNPEKLTYELSRQVIPDELVLPYSIRRVVETMVWMNREGQSGMLVAMPGACKTAFASLYCEQYEAFDDGPATVHIELLPGSSPAQLYNQLLSKLLPDGLPDRDEKGMYTPTEENLWALRLDVHHVLDNTFQGQLVLDNADRLPRRTLNELEDLASRFQPNLSIVLVGRNGLEAKLNYSTDEHWRFTKNVLFFNGPLRYDEMASVFETNVLPDEFVDGEPEDTIGDRPLATVSRTLASFLAANTPTDDAPNATSFASWKDKLARKYGVVAASTATTVTETAQQESKDIWTE